MSFIGQVTLSGVVILGSTTYFFEQVGLSTNQIYNLNLGGSGLAILSLFLFWFFGLPNVGRRTIYLVSGSIIVVILMIVGILQVHSADHSVGLAQAVLMLLFVVVFQGTIAPLGWALPAKSVPLVCVRKLLCWPGTHTISLLLLVGS